MVEAILKLATQMQIHTVAEGIDNASQVQYLKQAGCDMVQGYYYFLPMPMEEFCSKVFHEGQPGYADRAENSMTPSVQQHAFNKVTMFSLQTAADEITFSNLFSPVQEGRCVISNATSLFQHSVLIHENDHKDFFHLLERCQKEDGWVEDTIRFYTANGRYEWLEIHMHRESSLPNEEMIISGTNLTPQGVKPSLRFLIKAMSVFSRDPKLKLMLDEPHIDVNMLHGITARTLVLAGEKDMVEEEETLQIGANIPGAVTRILPGEGHGSYIVHKTTVAELIDAFIKGGKE
jgi:hypothetical protein